MKELVQGLKVNFLGHFLRFLRAAFFLLAAYLFGPENFGIYTLVWAVADLMIRLVTLGLEQGLLFDLSYLSGLHEEERLYRKIAASLKVALLLSTVSSILLGLYAYFFTMTPVVRHNLYLLVPTLPLNTAGLIFLHATMGMKEMRYRVIVQEVAFPVVMALSLLLFSQIHVLRPYGIVLSQCLALIVGFFLSVWAFQKFFSLKKLAEYFWSARDYASLIGYALPMYLIEVFDALLFRIDIFLLGAIMGTGTSEQKKLLGVYGLAKQISRVHLVTKIAFSPIFVAVSSEYHLRRESSEVWKTLRFSMEKMLLLNIPLGLFLVFFGRELLRIFGKDAALMPFDGYVGLVAGQFLYAVFSLLMIFLVVTQRSLRFLTLHFIILLASCFLVYWAIEAYGARGAGLTSGALYALVAGATVVETFRTLKRGFFSPKSLWICFAGAVCAALIFTLKASLPHAWGDWGRLFASFLPSLALYFLMTVKPSQWKGLIRWN